MTEKLKPCPICGGKADVQTFHKRTTLQYTEWACGQCLCVRTISAKEWNTRMPPTFTQEDINNVAIAIAENMFADEDDKMVVSAAKAALNVVGRMEE